jgi:hypothetical protein
VSRLQTTSTAEQAQEQTGKTRGLTTERWVAVYMLAALGFLMVTRRAFSDFVPR